MRTVLTWVTAKCQHSVHLTPDSRSRKPNLSPYATDMERYFYKVIFELVLFPSNFDFGNLNL